MADRDSIPHERKLQQLLQLRVLRLGFFQDGDVGVGVLPEQEEVLVLGLCFCHIVRQSVSSSEAQMRKRPDEFVLEKSRMVKNLLELCSRCIATLGEQIGSASH